MSRLVRHNTASLLALMVLAQVPMLFGFQLIGSSHMVRLAQYQGWELDERHPASIGLCRSGGTAWELVNKISTSNVGQRVMVMMGTNDILRGMDNHTLRGALNKVFRKLMEIAKEMIILTILPPPRFGQRQMRLLKKINRWLRSWESHRIKVADATNAFLKEDGSPNLDLFKR